MTYIMYGVYAHRDGQNLGWLSRQNNLTSMPLINGMIVAGTPQDMAIIMDRPEIKTTMQNIRQAYPDVLFSIRQITITWDDPQKED